MSERIEEHQASVQLPTPEQLSDLAQAIIRYGQETNSMLMRSPMAWSSIKTDPEANYVFRKYNDEQGRVLTQAAKLRRYYTGETFTLDGEQDEIMPFAETMYKLRYIERLHDVTAQLSRRAIYSFSWSEEAGVTQAAYLMDQKGSEYDVDADEPWTGVNQPVTSAHVEQLLREIEASTEQSS